MSPLRPMITAVMVLAVSSCSAETEMPPATTSTAPSTAGNCLAVARYGSIVTDELIDKGCTDDKGTTRKGTVKLCKDGRRLWEMDDMIGLSGGELVRPDRKSDDGIPAKTLFELACAQ